MMMTRKDLPAESKTRPAVPDLARTERGRRHRQRQTGERPAWRGADPSAQATERGEGRGSPGCSVQKGLSREQGGAWDGT